MNALNQLVPAFGVRNFIYKVNFKTFTHSCIFFFYWALSFELCHSDIAYSSIMEKFEGKSQSNFSKLGWEKFPLLIFIFSPTSKEIKKKPRKKLVAGFKVISCSLQSDLWWKVCQTKAFQQHSAAELSKFKPALHQHTTYQWNAHQREQIMFRISLSYLNHNKRLYESMYNEHLIFYPTSLHLFSFFAWLFRPSREDIWYYENFFCEAFYPNVTFKMRGTDTWIEFY